MAKETGADLKEALAAQREVLSLEAKIDQLADKKGKRAEKQLALAQKELAVKKEVVNNSNAYANYQKKINKDTETFGKSWTKLSSDVRNNLGGTNRSANVYASISTKIIGLEAKQASLSGDELEANMEMVARLREQNDSLLAQAKMTATAEAKARGMNDYAIKRKEIQEELNQLADEETDERREALELELEALNLKEKLEKKDERLASIAESQKDILDTMPEGVKNAVGFASKLGETLKTAGKGAAVFMILATILSAAMSEFTKLDEAAKEFRETTGLTNTQMKGVKDDTLAIRGYFADLGVEAKDVFGTVASLKGEFSDTAQFSQETVGAIAVLGANFGIAAETSAKVQSQLEAIGGLSSETAANVQMQLADMAKMAGVAPRKVFEDIAENAEATSTFFKGDVKLLAKQAIEARRLGSSLKESVELAEKLLDFEGGIEEELVAATFVGGQFNLSQARALAYQGDLVGAQKETLAQLQRTGDFRKKDYFTQQQLAKAANMSVEEINKQLNAQEKLNSLGYEERKLAEDAISKGLDITNINKENLALETQKFASQQEQQSQLDSLNNAFSGITATVGQSLVPLIQGLIPLVNLILFPIQAVAEGFRVTVEYLKEHIGLAITLASVMGIVYARSIGTAIADVWKGIVGFLGPFGIPVAIAATIGMVSMARNAMAQKAGDVMSPADGKTQVSTKEGGLFELSPNDDLVAAPGAASKLQQAAQMSKMGGVTSTGGGANSSNGMDALINEMKALRGDMNSGKIKTSTYLDGQKVSSTLGYSVDQNTRNSFNMSAI
jgi:hypothetical protein